MGTLCDGRSPGQVAAFVTLAAALLTACTEAPTRTEATSQMTAVQSPWAAPIAHKSQKELSQ